MLTMWKKIGFAVLLVAVLAALGACGTHNDAPTMSEDAIRQALVGKTWTLRKIVARSYDDDPARTLKFNADGTVQGFGGCNAFNGTYSLTGDQIEFSPLASTRKSCGPGLDEQEYTFLTFLAVVRHLRVEEDGSELVLLTESQGEMLFSSGSSGLFW